MRRSHTISLYIDVPYEAAYRFLADPANYGEWAAVDRTPIDRLAMANGKE